MSAMEGLKMKYFVLKPEGEDKYAEAARDAMRAYANTINQENPVLAKELREWAQKEMDAAIWRQRQPKQKCQLCNSIIDK